MGTAVERLGVVGAGFMGSGIAESCARAGIHVTLQEPDQGRLDKSRGAIEGSLTRAAKRGKLTDEEVAETLERIEWTTDLGALAGADGVCEAIVEDPQAKGKLFAKLDSELGDVTFLATNTSSIPIAQIAAWTQRPERVLGLHFFSPVPVMSLIEIVVGYDTPDDLVRLAEDFARAIGKHPVITKDRSGFIVNFLLVPYLMSAIRMYQDGFASREDLDEAMKRGCGHPMGPLTLADFIGLDVLYAIGDALFEEFKQPEYAPPPLLKRMVVSGRPRPQVRPGLLRVRVLGRGVDERHGVDRQLGAVFGEAAVRPPEAVVARPVPRRQAPEEAVGIGEELVRRSRRRCRRSSPPAPTRRCRARAARPCTILRPSPGRTPP